MPKAVFGVRTHSQKLYIEPIKSPCSDEAGGGQMEANKLIRGSLLSLFVLLIAVSPIWSQNKGLPEPKDAAVRDAERKALIEFYEALSGPDWIERDFWASDKPVGEWHGVTTDADGYVTVLTIYDNNLTGQMSPAVCRLQRLQTLHLSFNKISGDLPD